jgi:ABC-type glycerol-3-phosphate transport system permease component
VGIREIGPTAQMTGSLLAIAPMVAGFVFLQRYWQSGLARGIY